MRRVVLYIVGGWEERGEHWRNILTITNGLVISLLAGVVIVVPLGRKETCAGLLSTQTTLNTPNRESRFIMSSEGGSKVRDGERTPKLPTNKPIEDFIQH